LTNAEAIETMLAAIPVAPEHAALATLARTLATGVDRDANDSNTAREYRNVVTQLLELGSDGPTDDTQSFLLSIQTPVPAKVRNRKKS
jgi:hypothetical protein